MATEVEFGANGDAFEPSENWDDDFEFDPSSSSANTASSSPKTPRRQGVGSGRGRGTSTNAHAHYTRKMSIASSAGLSMVEDWDTDSVMGGCVGNVGFAVGGSGADADDNWDLGASTSTAGAGGSGSGAGTPRTPRTPRTPVGKAEKEPQVPHSQHVEDDTENWDDDFEDGSPRKSRLTSSRLQPASLLATSSNRRRRVSREGEQEESWDDEYEDSADEDGANDFGFHDKEEDRTVTAKSRRAALASSSSRSPPLPPPPLPPPIPMSTSRLGHGPFHIPTSQSYYDNPQPFPAPRSPSSSVFSVPNTVYSQSNSHNSNGSTSHLRPSSAFALLPPSPEIHHMRQRGRGRAEEFASSKMGGDAKDGKERRRLRKKSRPVPDGTFELKDVVSSLPSRPSRDRERDRYSFSDAEGELNIHATYPSAHGRDTPASAASMSDLSSGHGHGQGRPHARRSDGLPHPPEIDNAVPQTPRKPSNGPGSTLLSRIGSVKKWGVRRRSRGVSAAPENRQEVAISPNSQADPTSKPTSPEEHYHDQGKTSRPQSSRSSNAHTHSQRNSISVNPSASGSPSSNNWFFRGGSSSKHAPSDDRVSHGSPPVTVHRRGSVGGASHRSRSRSRTGSRAGTARDGIGKVGSPLSHHGSSPNILNGKSPSSIVTSTSLAGMSRKSMDSAGDVRFPAGDANVNNVSPSPYHRPMSTTATPDIHATPSKLAKRKSLGFVQLRRGLSTSRSQVSGYTSPERDAAKGKKKEDESDLEGAGESSGGRYGMLGMGRVGRPASKAPTTTEGEDSGERPRRKSFSRLLTDRGDKDKTKEKEKNTSGTMFVPMTPTKGDTPSSKDGSRGFMGSVRRISLVGRHRRMKSNGVPVSNTSPPSSARSSSVSRPLPTSSQSRHPQQGRGNLPYTLPPLPGTGSNISLRLPSGSNVDLPSMMRLVSINSSTSGRSGEESLRPASTVSISASSRQVSATSVAGAISDAEESASRRYGDLRTARPRRSSRSGSRSVSHTGEQGRSSGEVTRKVSTHSKRTSIIGMDFSPPSHSSSSFGSSSEDIPPLPRIASRTSQDIQRPVTPPYSKPSSPRTPSSSTLPPATPSAPKTPTNMKTPTPKNIKPHKSPKTPSRVPPLPTAEPDHPALPLLPPIELQPPSPPQTVKASSKTHGKAKRSLDVAFENLRFELNAEQEREGRPSFGSLRVDEQDATKGEGVSPATSTSSVFYTPKSSPKPGASPQKPKAVKHASPVGASLSPGRGVGAGQSASLGRTSGIDVSPRVDGVTASGGAGETEKAKEKSVSGWKRRNSLGDLKIPARISQAQVGLRRDLGMVREFAGSVEQLKDLQSTYYTLISEVQGVLDSYAQLHAQQAQEAARSASPHSDPRKSPTGSPSPVPRSTSPSFLSSLNLRKGRSRSNTVSSTTSLHAALSPTTESTNQAPQVPDVPLAIDDKKQAYKDLAAAFYSLNSRYKITLECAELLIDLGGSGSGGTTAGPSASASSQGQAISPAPLQPQHTGQRSTDGDPTLVTKRSRERAITLAGDESKPAVLVQVALPLSTSVLLTSPVNNYPPPTTSPAESYSHNSWRASTGRHDLSQRQLVLLREMLNNSSAANAVADEGLGVVEEGTPVSSPNPISPPPPLTFPPSATSTYDSGPQTAPLPSSAPAPYGEGQMIVNWDWRWGDPRNSTITLPSPSEEAALHSKFAEIVTRDKEKEREREKKRRSTRLGMSGIRDMLRALKRTADAQITATTSPGSGNTLPPPPMPVHYHSTTSLSTESSASAERSQVAATTTKGSRPSSRARYPLPIPRMPSLSHTHSSGNSNPSGTTGRRRAKTSTGPESMRGMEDAGLNANGTAPSFVPPKASPRRPSLASIFRIGKSSEKTQQAQQLQQQQAQQIASQTMSPEPLHSASTYASTGAASQDNPSSSGHQNHNPEPYAPGELDGDLSNTSIDAETSDWDRMDSASDLDAAAKALSRSSGPNKLSKFKHVKKGKSPYLFMRGGDDKKGNGNGSGKEGVSSSSSVFVAGQSQELLGRMGNQSQSQTGLVTKRSFCASQGSLLETAGGSAAAGVPQRMTRLSGVEEMRDHEQEHEQVPAQAAIEENDPPFSASSTRSSAHGRVSSGSRPSSSRSTRSLIYGNAAQGQPQNFALSQAQKTGSVRSMPPHLTASASLPPLGGSQRPVSGPYPSSSSAHPYATASGRHGQHHHHHHHQAHAAATHGGDVNIRLAMTPENIKPLLENAREVLARLAECIDEVKALSGRCKELVDDVGGQRGVVQQEAVVS